MAQSESQGKIFVAYHKPFSVIKKDFIVPVHAGRACVHANKDNVKNQPYRSTMLNQMIGDDTGDNISERNHEYNECSVLYWAWKNVDFSTLKYVGFFQYRRQLILNDYFDHAKDDFEKRVYRCVHFPKITPNFCQCIGLTEAKILSLLEQYDCLTPYPTNLKAMNISSSYEDWVRKIPGVHINDLVALERLMQAVHPELADSFKIYLNSPQKLMYQIFIAKPEIANEYCAWLFDLLFKIDPLIDTSLYSINGKRTLGYLAEILYGFYFTHLKETHRVKECGVAFINK